MSWEEINIEAITHAAHRNIPVAVTLGGTRHGFDRVTVTVRPSLLDDMSWWIAEARVAVLLGSGEHAGQIRIEPRNTGPYKLVVNGRQTNARIHACSLNCKLPAGAAPEPRPNGEVEFDYGDKWLELTLPKPSAPAKAVPPAPIIKAPPAAPASQFKTAATAGGVRPKVGGR